MKTTNKESIDKLRAAIAEMESKPKKTNLDNLLINNWKRSIRLIEEKQ